VSEHGAANCAQPGPGVAVTGVVAVVALRANMDALSVEEQVDLPFTSRIRAQWDGARL
jgi:metal-dependent amidase/aminoacylase/carboxypeptidase family protein